MEPYIVFIPGLVDGKISLTEEEFKTIIKRAYDDGYADGIKNYSWGPYYWPINTPVEPYRPIIWTSSSTSTKETITSPDKPQEINY